MPSFVGIDVSKQALDVCVRPSGERFSVSNDETGIGLLLEKLEPCKKGLIVLEATGGFEHAAAASLASAGFQLAIVNPRQVRDFAKATGQLAKTDSLDADVLSLFAERVRPDVRPLPDEVSEELKALVARRRQIVEMLTAEKNRLGMARERLVRRSIESHIRWLKRQLEDTNSNLGGTLKKSPIWRAKDDLLRSVPGVGQVLSRTLIADLPELGHVSNKEIAALVGVAPFAKDSGRHKGQRCIWGGRAHVRSALYMAALVGLRHNPTLQAYYQRLRSLGKPPKLALTACMRKLLIILNAILRSNTPWSPSIP